MQEIAMWASLWKEIDRDEFQKLWETEAVEAEAKVDIETVNVATGLLLPVWHRLPQDDVRVWRIDDGKGISIIGRLIPRSEESRGGKECVSTCSSRWSREH